VSVAVFPFLIFFISFFFYLNSAFPSIYWRDAPEFQAVGFLLDIAHPAGSPLYTIVAKLFTLIPVGSIAFKVILVSCFFGALMSVLLYWVILAVLKCLSGETEDRFRPNFISVIAFFCALVFSFSNALWENANVPEVYTLQNFFTLLFMFILLKLEDLRSHLPESKQDLTIRLLMTLSFLFGLSLGAHAILVLYLPLFVLWIYFYYLRPASFKTSKIISLLLFFFLLAFSVYLHLPIRSEQNLYYDWGNPETFQNLMTHASDRKDADYLLALPNSISSKQMSTYLDFYPDNFSYLGVGLGLVGFFYLFVKKKSHLLLFFAFFFSPPFLFFVRYWGEASAFIPNFIVFCILMSIGFFAASVKMKNLVSKNLIRRSYIPFILVLITVQFVLLFVSHLKENNGSDYWVARNVSRNILNSMPPNAIVISNLTWFMLSYLQQTEAYRPDLSVLSLTSLLAPDVYSKLDQNKFQNIVIPEVSLRDLGPEFLSQNVEYHPIYWETAGQLNTLVDEYLVPDGLFFRVSRNPPEIDQKLVKIYFEKLGKQLPFADVSDNWEERVLFSQIISGMGDFFMQREKYQAAGDHFELAKALVPSNSSYVNSFGAAYARMQKHELAEKAFLEATALNPESHLPYSNLGELYYFYRDFEKAETYFSLALSRSPNNKHSLFALGEISLEKGDKKSALYYFKRLMEIYPDDEAARAQVAVLSGEAEL